MPVPSADSTLVQFAGGIVNATVPTVDGLQVICAWPVSGQYGPGSRILYYVLVAICVLARKSDWLRNACLAATLLIPMVAALHGIVLAAVDVQHAVDLDIYGAFQLCAIGVLVAPVTAKLSRTYFKGPGHNAIILWSFIVVAGLISLTVEFTRVAGSTFDCRQDNNGNSLNSTSPFPYGQADCNITCSPDNPRSRIRLGSGNNIYVIPAPHALTFNVGILLSAACCIPAILLVAALLLRSFKTNWNSRHVDRLKLKLRAFIFVFEIDGEAPTIEDINAHVRPLVKLGIVRTAAVRECQRATWEDKAQSAGVERNETVGDGQRQLTTVPVADGFADMFNYLGLRSTLTKYDYEISGSPLQVLEFKLSENIYDDEIATELRTALQDLDQEGVDAIVVEGLPYNIGDRVNWIMQKLRDDQIVRTEGTPTSGKTSRVGKLLEKYTMVVVFSALVVAILIVGERNFWTLPVNYQTEPIGNIGQWAPIAGTILLMAGSIYVLVAEETRKERRRQRKPPIDEREPDGHFKFQFRRFIGAMIDLSNMLSPQRKRFDDSDFQEHAQKNYPTVPGEQNKVAGLQETITNYLQRTSSVSSFANISDSASIRSTSFARRERSHSELSANPPARRITLELPESPHPVHRPRRSTQLSRPDVSPDEITSIDNQITLVVTKPDETST